jgi:hypothetical protein
MSWVKEQFLRQHHEFRLKQTEDGGILQAQLPVHIGNLGSPQPLSAGGYPYDQHDQVLEPKLGLAIPDHEWY